jgi:hypothetical protein
MAHVARGEQVDQVEEVARSAQVRNPVADWRDILGFEQAWWRGWDHRRPKELAIRDQFGISAARYYQLLNRVIDSPEALAQDPMLVRRLRRIREVRRQKRHLSGLGSRA